MSSSTESKSEYFLRSEYREYELPQNNDWLPLIACAAAAVIGLYVLDTLHRFFYI